MAARKILSSSVRLRFDNEEPIYGFYDKLLIDSTVTYPDMRIIPDSPGFRCMRTDIEANVPSRKKLKGEMLRALYDFVRDEINAREKMIDTIITELHKLESEDDEK